MLQDMYREHGDLVEIRIWRRRGSKTEHDFVLPGGPHTASLPPIEIVDKQTVTDLLNVIHQREDVLKRLRNDSVYLKYVAGARHRHCPRRHQFTHPLPATRTPG